MKKGRIVSKTPKRKESKKEKAEKLIRGFQREVRMWKETHTDIACGLKQIGNVVYLVIKNFRATKRFVAGVGMVKKIPEFNRIQKIEIQGFIDKLRRIFTEFSYKSIMEKVTAVVCAFALPAELVST